MGEKEAAVRWEMKTESFEYVFEPYEELKSFGIQYYAGNPN